MVLNRPTEAAAPQAAVRSLDPIKVLIILLALFGLAFLVLSPPFQAPDENLHFARSYAVSEGDFFAQSHPIPDSFLALWNQVAAVPFHPEVKVRLNDLQPALLAPVNPDKTTGSAFPATLNNSPIAYIPQALGIAIGRALALNVGGVFYLGRLMNLIAYGLLALLAMRLLPVHRWAFLLLAVMPMALFQAASYSADGLKIGLAYVLVAQILRLSSRAVEQVSWREIGWLALLSALVSLTTVPCFLLAMAFFIIPAAKLGDRKAYWLKAAAVLLPAVLIVLVTQLPQAAAPQGIPYITEETGSAAAKLQYAAANPAAFALMLARAAIHTPRTYTGVLGWLDAPLMIWVYIAYPLALLLALTLGSDVLRFTRFQRWFSLGLSLVVMLVIALMMYIAYTPLGSAEIMGVQGRYFLPLGLLPYLVLSNESMNKNGLELRWWILPGLVTVVLASACFSLFVRYWGV